MRGEDRGTSLELRYGEHSWTADHYLERIIGRPPGDPKDVTKWSAEQAGRVRNP